MIGQHATSAFQRVINQRSHVPFTRFQHCTYPEPAHHFAVTTSDGETIRGTHVARNRKSALIVCHGFADHHRTTAMTWLATGLARQHDIIAFDWRGYGASSGESSFGERELYDLLAVFEYARLYGYERLGLVGDSMGGLIVLVAQARFALAERIATAGAPADFAMTGRLHATAYTHLASRAIARRLTRPLLGFRMGPIAAVCSRDVIGEISAPLLLVHGERDHIVPVTNAYLLHQAAQPHAELRVYPGCAHAAGAMRRMCPDQAMSDLLAHFAPLRAA